MPNSGLVVPSPDIAEIIRLARDIDRRVIRLEERQEQVMRDILDRVTRAEFVVVKALVFGASGMILMAAFAAILVRIGLKP